MVKVVKKELGRLIKFLVVLSVIGMLASCASTQNGVVLGKTVKCKGGVCSMY